MPTILAGFRPAFYMFDTANIRPFSKTPNKSTKYFHHDHEIALLFSYSWLLYFSIFFRMSAPSLTRMTVRLSIRTGILFTPGSGGMGFPSPSPFINTVLDMSLSFFWVIKIPASLFRAGSGKKKAGVPGNVGRRPPLCDNKKFIGLYEVYPPIDHPIV